eukprot:355782-Chlamydomonas_euryale.AAC.13
MYESDDIIDYLFDTYGPGKDQVPFQLRAGPLTVASLAVGALARSGKGGRARANHRMPEQPLEFWGYEASPFVKVWAGGCWGGRRCCPFSHVFFACVSAFSHQTFMYTFTHTHTVTLSSFV